MAQRKSSEGDLDWYGDWIDVALKQTPRGHDGANRLLHLFAVSCIRAATELIPPDPILAAAADEADRFADGLLTVAEIKGLRKQIKDYLRDIGPHVNEQFERVLTPEREATRDILIALELATASKVTKTGCAVRASYAYGAMALPNYGEGCDRADPQQFAFARDIFGNPFRPVAFDPVWRSSEAKGIAVRMYDSREFSAMPILADALEEAGCDNVAVLLHCRAPGTHVRGCWVVDLVLDKK